jgi:hypothetical protein
MRAAIVALLLAVGLMPGAVHAQGARPPAATSSGPFTFTIPQSQVVVKVTDTSLRPDPPANNNPSYFKVSRSDPQLILSGWLEPAARYKGLEAFWEGEKKSPAMAGPLAPTRIEILRNAPWEIVAYDIPLPGGITSAHLRAERVLAGTWIDLHLSATSTRPAATLRAELVAALAKVEVAQK